MRRRRTNNGSLISEEPDGAEVSFTLLLLKAGLVYSYTQVSGVIPWQAGMRQLHPAHFSTEVFFFTLSALEEYHVCTAYLPLLLSG